jgi:hypothetical protein
MAEAPEASLPTRHEPWADLQAAYRFFANHKVTPDEIQRTHRQRVRAQCATHSVILAIQDGSELDFTSHRSVEGLGFVGGGLGQGLLQHSTLAASASGDLLGVLHQIWWKRTLTPEGETRRERQARSTEASLWAESIRAVGRLGDATRVIHVMDRGGDNFETMQEAIRQNAGFLIRARHDRLVNGSDQRLWSWMSSRPVAGTRDIHIPSQPPRDGKPARAARDARLALRYAPVTLAPPVNDPRFTEPLTLWVVCAVEVDPPAGCEPVEWMLLTSERIDDAAAANRCVDWYTYRWMIEEWHKVLKTGCRLEASQLKTADGLMRLAALAAVIAIRMLQLRDAVHAALEPSAPAPSAQKNTPQALRAIVPGLWIKVVSYLAKVRPDELTPVEFWRTIAKKGGFIGRKNDGLPGWQTIWRGWSRVAMIVMDMEICQSILQDANCV